MEFYHGDIVTIELAATAVRAGWFKAGQDELAVLAPVDILGPAEGAFPAASLLMGAKRLLETSVSGDYRLLCTRADCNRTGATRPSCVLCGVRLFDWAPTSFQMHLAKSLAQTRSDIEAAFGSLPASCRIGASIPPDWPAAVIDTYVDLLNAAFGAGASVETVEEPEAIVADAIQSPAIWTLGGIEPGQRVLTIDAGSSSTSFTVATVSPDGGLLDVEFTRHPFTGSMCDRLIAQAIGVRLGVDVTPELEYFWGPAVRAWKLEVCAAFGDGSENAKTLTEVLQLPMGKVRDAPLKLAVQMSADDRRGIVDRVSQLIWEAVQASLGQMANIESVDTVLLTGGNSCWPFSFERAIHSLIPNAAVSRPPSNHSALMFGLVNVLAARDSQSLGRQRVEVLPPPQDVSPVRIPAAENITLVMQQDELAAPAPGTFRNLVPADELATEIVATPAYTPPLQRRSADAWVVLAITPEEARLGATKTVAGSWGEEDVLINPETREDQEYRIAHRGPDNVEKVIAVRIAVRDAPAGASAKGTENGLVGENAPSTRSDGGGEPERPTLPDAAGAAARTSSSDRTSAGRRSQGQDVHSTLTVSEQEASVGCSKSIFVLGRAVSVLVPPQTVNDAVIVVPNEGESDASGRRRGDLHIRVSVVPETSKDSIRSLFNTNTEEAAPTTRPRGEAGSRRRSPAVTVTLIFIALTGIGFFVVDQTARRRIAPVPHPYHWLYRTIVKRSIARRPLPKPLLHWSQKPRLHPRPGPGPHPNPWPQPHPHHWPPIYSGPAHPNTNTILQGE